MKIGEPVIYIDSHRQQHAAIVTAVFDNGDEEKHPSPAVNLAYVSGDEARRDSFGRQLERSTSTAHISNNSAGANCWKRATE